MERMAGKVILLALRVALAWIFLKAGVLKIWDFAHWRSATPDFALAIQHYQIVPWPDLTMLFAVQRFGTAAVGKFFGWAMLVWFGMIAVLGARQIIHEPSVWGALNPIYCFTFLKSLTVIQRFVVLGYVMLALH